MRIGMAMVSVGFIFLLLACNNGDDDDLSNDDDGNDDLDDDDADDDTDDDTGTDDDSGGDDDAQPLTWPSNHSEGWDCYLCHATDFLGSTQEPHGHLYTAPADCVQCHQAGTWTNPPSGPLGPSGHDHAMNCAQCHPQKHEKPWQENAQCFVCHEVGTSPQPPTYSTNHDADWNCYLCHQTAFLGSPKEPHSHFYTAPAPCVLCHLEGTWTHQPTQGGHNPGSNCLLCHQGRHGKVWEDKSQCLLCHNPSGGDDDNTDL